MKVILEYRRKKVTEFLFSDENCLKDQSIVQ